MQSRLLSQPPRASGESRAFCVMRETAGAHLPCITPLTLMMAPGRFVLTALDGGPGKSCEFQLPKPAESSGLNSFDDPEAETDGFPTEAVVVLSPLWALSNATAALLDRHIEHYAMLGFTG